MNISNTKSSAGELDKKFSATLKSISTADLRDMLTILYSEPELAIHNMDPELGTEELKRHLKERSKMESFDQVRLAVLRTKLVDDFHIFESIEIPDPVLGTSPSYPKASLLTALIKTKLNLIETGKELPDELTIKQIECFTSDKSDNDYWIVINGGVSSPLKVSKNIKIWSMFFDLVSNGYVDRNNETQDLYDYLNYNPNNKIRTNTKYPKQEIIEQFDNSLKPKFKASVQTEKALVQRQNKLKSST
ncbi:MAG: hypothetical protein NTZ36_03615 [Candidatus Jorgensenbacteria bacterium]|nr:hypothetical protein [Candidatus Jorgensenbacteria bacterium]